MQKKFVKSKHIKLACFERNNQNILFFFFAVLPELPVAGPSPAGPTCPSSNYLYHNTISEESGHLLSRPNDALASQLGLALASTTVDHVVLNAKNISAFSQQGVQQPVMTSNTSHLQGALFRRDQTLFTPLNRQQQLQVQQQQLRWNNNGAGTNTAGAAVSASTTPNMDPPNYSPNYGHHSPASNMPPQSGFNPQAQQQQQNMYNMQTGGGYNQFGYNQQQQHMITNNTSGGASGGGAQQLQQQQQQHQTPQQQQHPPQQQHSGLSHGQSPLQQQQHSQQQQPPQQQSNSQQQLQHQQQHPSTNGEMVSSQSSTINKSQLPTQDGHQQQQMQQQTPPSKQQQQQQMPSHQVCVYKIISLFIFCVKSTVCLYIYLNK